jgi:hypothetical protein
MSRAPRGRSILLAPSLRASPKLPRRHGMGVLPEPDLEPPAVRLGQQIALANLGRRLLRNNSKATSEPISQKHAQPRRP